MADSGFDPAEGPRLVRKILDSQAREVRGEFRTRCDEAIVTIEATDVFGAILVHVVWRHDPEDGALRRTDYGRIRDRRRFAEVWRRLGQAFAVRLSDDPETAEDDEVSAVAAP